MEEHLNGFKVAVATLVAALTAFWGWFGWLVVAWIVAEGLDYITGSCAALKNGTWSSKAAREGIWHKVGAALAVLASGLLDLVLGLILPVSGLALPFTYTVFFCPVVVIWYILTEIGSVIENVGAMGAKFPGWLQKAIAELRNKVDQKQDDRSEE